MPRLSDVNYNGLYCVLWGWSIPAPSDALIAKSFPQYTSDTLYRELVPGQLFIFYFYNRLIW